MNLVACKKSDMRKTPRENIYKLIMEFVRSDAECALVAGAEVHYANHNVGARSITAAIKRYKIAGVKAVANDGKVYLVREVK